MKKFRILILYGYQNTWAQDWDEADIIEADNEKDAAEKYVEKLLYEDTLWYREFSNGARVAVESSGKISEFFVTAEVKYKISVFKDKK